MVFRRVHEVLKEVAPARKTRYLCAAVQESHVQVL
jgi:hypothetical protein